MGPAYARSVDTACEARYADGMTEHNLETLKDSHALKQATPEQIEAAVRDEDIRSCIDEAWVHEGDLVLDGDLGLYGGAVLIVDGDLTLTGSAATDETATLVVTKNLTGRHLFLEGNLEVHGDAKLRGVVYGFYEAGVSFVYGSTTAKVGLFGNHCWECDDEHYEVDVRFSNYRALRSGDAEALRALMGDDDFRKIAKLIGVSDEDPPGRNAAWGLGPFDKIAP